MGWYHFASDDLAHWVALDGTNPSSNVTGIPTDGVGCPNTRGCFSGSTTVTNISGSPVPTIVYPGVHTVPKDADHPDGKPYIASLPVSISSVQNSHAHLFTLVC